MRNNLTGLTGWSFAAIIVFLVVFVVYVHAQELKDVPHVKKSVVIVEVKDGDTLVAKGGVVIRLLGVNTPEKAWPYAQTATEFVKRWVAGKKVILKISKKFPKDKYGRTLAVLYVADRKVSLNLKIISVGLGKVLVEDNDLVNEKYWRVIQEKAVKMKRGIWGTKR